MRCSLRLISCPPSPRGGFDRALVCDRVRAGMRVLRNDDGMAVVIALLLAVLLGAIAAALVALTTTETLISLSFRHAQEASHGAEAALERALARPRRDGGLVARLGCAACQCHLDLRRRTDRAAHTGRAQRSTCRSSPPSGRRESDIRAGPDVFGADSPEWRLFAHAPLSALMTGAGLDLPLYLVVWVADDEWDGDGNPAVDSNGRILVRAHGVRGRWRRALGRGPSRTDRRRRPPAPGPARAPVEAGGPSDQRDFPPAGPACRR